MPSSDDALGLASLRSTPGIDHDVIGQDRRVIGLAALIRLTTSSTASGFVQPVGLMRAIVDVVRSTAWRVITVMARDPRQVPMRQVKSDSRRRYGLWLFPWSRPFELAVFLSSLFSSARSPRPARILAFDDVHLGPESFGEIHMFTHVKTIHQRNAGKHFATEYGLVPAHREVMPDARH
jgi:hypothetical protein